MQHDKRLTINFLIFKIDCRNRIKFVFYLLADSLGITFRIIKPDYLIIITNTKYQHTPFTIRKSRHTFEPTFRSFDLKHLFFVVGCCFSD